MQDSMFIGLDVHKATISVAVADGMRGGEAVQRRGAIRLFVNRRAKLTPYRRPILTPPFGSQAVIPVVDRRGPRTTTRTVRCAGGGVRGRSLLTHRVNRRGWGSGGRGFRLSSGF